MLKHLGPPFGIIPTALFLTRLLSDILYFQNPDATIIGKRQGLHFLHMLSYLNKLRLDKSQLASHIRRNRFLYPR